MKAEYIMIVPPRHSSTAGEVMPPHCFPVIRSRRSTSDLVVKGVISFSTNVLVSMMISTASFSVRVDILISLSSVQLPAFQKMTFSWVRDATILDEAGAGKGLSIARRLGGGASESDSEEASPADGLSILERLSMVSDSQSWLGGGRLPRGLHLSPSSRGGVHPFVG